MGQTGTRGDLLPPDFLRLAGHPVRWRLLSELAQSDRRVGELTELLGRPQNLVSYHLGRLRAEHVVSMRRSSADGRDTYYSLDLRRCRDLLAATGAALHPGLGTPWEPPRAARPPRRPRAQILFLCTGNSARSQMAEALAEHRAPDSVEAFSAGSHPKRLHANAVRAMREHGIDIAGRSAKHLSEFAAWRFDYVITLCDRVREVCPEFPAHPSVAHWSIADPGREASGDDEASYPAFQRTATELAGRVSFLLESIDHTPTNPGAEHAQR
ncbi:MAG TPA: ArsR family transcriptional regulator [Baekduia sp.]|uniref:arsenate reductase/protein-tyrosine-phosphatase family protein n=1 Tax=Baekduia sp. TaxID=2600305 RepID=UPI002C0A71C9|nr:ArsR family transcriptional regulator [Baekduia sp.]HMJ36342.1 ArsR family transcriptional regulator [Baekduia sp.]